MIFYRYSLILKMIMFLSFFLILISNLNLASNLFVNFNYKVKYIFLFFIYYLFFISLVIFTYNKFHNKFNLLSFRYTVFIPLFAIIITIIVLKFITFDYVNKYTLTGLNEHRATHWLTTFQDFGFIKRSFVGTIYRLLFSSIPNFVGILLLSWLVLLAKVGLIIIFLKKIYIKYDNSIILTSIVFFISSPYFIYFYSADLGRFDQFNNLIMLMMLILVPNFYLIKNFLLICCLAILGILIHESFILLQFPLVIFLIFLEIIKNNIKNNNLKGAFSFLIILFISLITGLIVAKFGYPNNLTADEMIKVIGFVESFDIRHDVLDTFFYVPWQNLNILDNFVSNMNINQPSSNLFILIEFFLLNFPFLIFNIYLMIEIQNSIHQNYYKFNKLIYFIIVFPFIVSLLITFNDYYRIFATITLMIFVSNIYFLNQNKVNLKEISNQKISELLFLGIFYNIFITGITVITSYSSSSPSIYLYFMNTIYN